MYCFNLLFKLEENFKFNALFFQKGNFLFSIMPSLKPYKGLSFSARTDLHVEIEAQLPVIMNRNGWIYTKPVLQCAVLYLNHNESALAF